MTAARDEQREAALERANRSRSKRAKLRRELREMSQPEGRSLAADILEREELDDWMLGITVTWLLRSIYGFGRWRVQRLCAASGLSPEDTLNEVGLRKRRRLAAGLILG